MRTAAAFVAGLVFGLGLIVSGMANPAKVLGFLDVAGSWDPSLAMVMIGAMALSAVGFQLARGRFDSLLGDAIELPTRRRVDAPLVIGGLMFGVGWGIAGFCPGPAIVAVGMGSGKAVLFTAAMLVGMGAFELVSGRLDRRTAATTSASGR